MHVLHFQLDNIAVQATKIDFLGLRGQCFLCPNSFNWFVEFRSGNFHLKEKDWSWRPAEDNDEQMQEILEEDPIKSTKATELA